jgi:hypothetical protein
MKLLCFLLLFSFANPPEILVIDTGLKNEIKTTVDFTIDDYFKRSFPVYADDMQAVIDATEKIAKRIDRNEQCTDTIRANRTVMYLNVNCGTKKGISVRLFTKLEGQNVFFDFELVRNQPDRRIAQQRLLDFATYLGN